MKTGHGSPAFLAALDIGSNSVKISVALALDKGLAVRAQIAKVTRLGQGMESGRLLSEAMERTFAAICGELAWLRGKVTSCALAAVATSAVRDAANGREFLETVRERCGLDSAPLLLGGEDEARLVFDGASMPMEPGGLFLNADSGGGSTELILGIAGGGMLRSRSFQVGAVRWMERFGLEGRSRPEDLDAAFQAAVEVFSGFGAVGAPFLSVTGGTAYAAACLAAGSKLDFSGLSEPVPMQRIEELADRLARMDVEERKAVPGILEDRANIMPAALVVLSALGHALGYKSFVANSCGLRHGILRGLAEGSLEPQLVI